MSFLKRKKRKEKKRKEKEKKKEFNSYDGSVYRKNEVK